MIAELGHFALILALLPRAGAVDRAARSARARGHAGLMAVGQSAAVAQFAADRARLRGAGHAYVTSDFSVANVVENSQSTKPMLYKITGVWGNHEGSMLLWVLILTLFGAAVALLRRQSAADACARACSRCRA